MKKSLSSAVVVPLFLIIQGPLALAAESSASQPPAAKGSNAAESVGTETRLGLGLSIPEQLRALSKQRKRVTLLLRGGQNLTGIVNEASSSQILLSELAGKEFFDALIRVEDVSALEVQVRHR